MDASRLPSSITIRLLGQLEQPAVEMLIPGWAGHLHRLVMGWEWRGTLLGINGNGRLNPTFNLVGKQFKPTKRAKDTFEGTCRNLLGYASHIVPLSSISY